MGSSMGGRACCNAKFEAPADLAPAARGVMGNLACCNAKFDAQANLAPIGRAPNPDNDATMDTEMGCPPRPPYVSPPEVDNSKKAESPAPMFVTPPVTPDKGEAYSNLNSPPQNKPFIWTVELDHTNTDKKLGIEIDMGGDTLPVLEVKGAGSIPDWNRSVGDQSRRVQEGDHIFEVNGIRDRDRMIKECGKKAILKMTLVRFQV
eukprot:gnl/MRDRNA2_/MRDRNA2_175118_c0_seq1.p1 gnl/MRDRNA2_/MRDRNA2_175118_c0~~gnl/MRDRNA2_/MRDRNA2_175118_c0_seq1.p1  ORF type:complete len:205 (-),score=34.84 gnl/MRDRNA2_/MRDRNA2_175118_c0_seq1:10-624(-)